jgi:outer membrane protein OmpA-like peptidoglycan-associated protein
LLKELGAGVTAQEIPIELAADVLFDFDKAELRADALDALRKVATVIASTPGPVDLARQGGRHRCARISTRGLGETQLKVPNAAPDGSDDPAGRQRNRFGVTAKEVEK